MENNRQRTVIVAIVALMIVGVIGTTIAYFTSETVFRNQFKTPAHESEFTEEFSSPENWLPGDEEKKEVSVKNTGEYDIAVRISYTEEWIGGDGVTQLPLVQDQDGTEVRAAIINFPNKQDWGKRTEDDGVTYYYYKDILGKGESTSLFMDKVTFNKDIKNDQNCTNVYTYSDGSTSKGTAPEEGKTVKSTTQRCESTGQTYAGGTYILTIKIETIQWDQYKNGWGVDEDLEDLEWDKTIAGIMKKYAIIDNIASKYVLPYTGINFSENSSDTNGKGIYIRAGSENNEHPIYYYRGDVDDNNLLFAGFCWKIVRTTETGGIKLIYNGLPNDGVCNNIGEATQIGTSAFNSEEKSPAFVGYMSGVDFSSYDRKYEIKSFTLSSSSNIAFGNDVEWDGVKYTLKDVRTGNDSSHHYTCMNSGNSCEKVAYVYLDTSGNNCYFLLMNGENVETAKTEMFSNNYDSDIKKVLDGWYSNNLTDYTNYLEDTIWCNDRTLYGGGLYSNNSALTHPVFDTYRRVWLFEGPDVSVDGSCSNVRDRFTVSKSKGNGKLTYPIGLITADEAVLGGLRNPNIPTSYLYTTKDYWTMSPMMIGIGALDFYSMSDGMLADGYVTSVRGVRPSVSLKSELSVLGGDGTVENPFVVTR